MYNYYMDNYYTIQVILSFIVFCLIIISFLCFLHKVNTASKPKLSQKEITNRNRINDLDRMIYSCSQNISMPPIYYYIPDRQYYNEFFRNPYREENIKNVTYHILKCIGYNGPMPTVQYSLTGNQLSKHIANECRTYIIINSQPRRIAKELYSLIIHECMNLYIFDKQMKIDGISQEAFADVAAIYFGFHEYLLNGYIYTNKNLSKNDINYIMQKINRWTIDNLIQKTYNNKYHKIIFKS